MTGDYIKRIRTEGGDKQIDYKALANLPKTVSLTDEVTGKAYTLYASNGKLMMKESEG